MDGLSYQNALGDTVMTARYLRSRKTCCKSGCLHCPYGHTLKKFGLTFRDITLEELSTYPQIDQNKWEPNSIKVVLLKEVMCGVICIDKLFVREMYLRPEFQDQDLTKELIESYYFY
jgi:hypothetical protein